MKLTILGKSVTLEFGLGLLEKIGRDKGTEYVTEVLQDYAAIDLAKVSFDNLEAIARLIRCASGEDFSDQEIKKWVMFKRFTPEGDIGDCTKVMRAFWESITLDEGNVKAPKRGKKQPSKT